MHARSAYALAGLALALTVTLPPVVAAAEGGDDALVLREKFTQTVVQDLGKKGVTMGDRLIYASEMRDLHGAKVGIGAGDLVVFAGSTEANAKYHGTETYRLGNDYLFVGGMYDNSRKITKWAIAGGTGRFRGATGQVDYTTLSPDTFTATFHID